jgi:hypothetical protein
MTLRIKIKKPGAKKLLEDLAALDLIEVEAEKDVAVKRKKEKTLTHLASEQSLAKTWDNEKEDKAWQDL